MAGTPLPSGPSSIMAKATEFRDLRDTMARNFLVAAQQPVAMPDPCDRPLPHDAEVALSLANKAARAANKADRVATLVATGAMVAGICEDCREEIPKKRLAAMPHATRCVDCQASAETAKGPLRYVRRLGASKNHY